MKIDEVIAELTKLKEEHGDLHVVVQGGACSQLFEEVGEVNQVQRYFRTDDGVSCTRKCVVFAL